MYYVLILVTEVTLSSVNILSGVKSYVKLTGDKNNLPIKPSLL